MVTWNFSSPADTNQLERSVRHLYENFRIDITKISARLGLVRVIRIVQLGQIHVPFVVGCLRPIVVLPIAAMSQLNVAQVEAILAHELAHVRRHDYVVNLMQTLAETLLFYHPAVWWISGLSRPPLLRQFREQWLTRPASPAISIFTSGGRQIGFFRGQPARPPIGRSV